MKFLTGFVTTTLRVMFEPFGNAKMYHPAIKKYDSSFVAIHSASRISVMEMLTSNHNVISQTLKNTKIAQVNVFACTKCYLTDSSLKVRLNLTLRWFRIR